MNSLFSNEILGPLDSMWAILSYILAACLIVVWKPLWIKPGPLVLFLVGKISIGIWFSLWALSTSQDFDAFTHYLVGQDFARMLKELASSGSLEYFETTPFFGVSADATERTRSLIGLISVVTGSFIGCSLIFGAFGSIGQLLMFRYMRQRFPKISEYYFLPILFYPSLMVWSSHLTKDSIGIFALGLMMYNMDRFFLRWNILNAAAFSFGLWMALGFRSFIVLLIAIYSFIVIWDRRLKSIVERSQKREVLTIIFAHVAIVMAIAMLLLFAKRYGSDLAETQRSTNEVYARINAGSNFINVELDWSLTGLLALPVGLFNSLLRPLPSDVRNVSQAFACVENVVVLLFVLRGFWCYATTIRKKSRVEIKHIYWGMALMTFICGAGVGLFSSNAGTISRYRIPLIPFYLGGACIVYGIAHAERKRSAIPKNMPYWRFSS